MAMNLSERRLELDSVLRSIVKDRCGAENVYYQPPTGLKMKYPCIVYNRDTIRNRHADDGVYSQNVGYELTVIDTKPDSSMTAAVSALPKCAYGRHFISDNLHHDVMTVWY